MFVNDEHFETWMEQLSKKLSEIGKDLKSLVNTFAENSLPKREPLTLST
jgi:hypothetical protein